MIEDLAVGGDPVAKDPLQHAQRGFGVRVARGDDDGKAVGVDIEAVGFTLVDESDYGFGGGSEVEEDGGDYGGSDTGAHVFD